MESADTTAAAWGRFELSSVELRTLVQRQAVWMMVQGATSLLLAVAPALLGTAAVSPAMAMGLATGLGVVASRPARAQLLPLVLAAVVLGTVALAAIGVSAPIAAGACAGVAVARGGALARIEAVLAGVAGAGFGAVFVPALGIPVASAAGALLAGLVTGLLVSYTLLPGALRFRSRSRIPSVRVIRASLDAPYRAPCLRAYQLDQELGRNAPDAESRDGLAEVAGWVYRLGQTLQMLDADIARIDPVDVRARMEALAGEGGDDAFVKERRQSTRRHLDRLLEHREALTAERNRTAALQDHALAWLEDARGGLALARLHPGEDSPERLDTVLDRLRAHAASRTAQRSAARELAGL